MKYMKVFKNRIVLLGLFVALCSPVFVQLFSETTYFTSFLANALIRNNLNEVVPNRFYRSAQMSREDLMRNIKEHGIRTIIDLRLDEDAPDDSGLSEAEASQKAGASYTHIPMSSSKAGQKEQLQKLLKTFQTATPPILVHCSSGTHRTGVASALWLLEQEKQNLETAQQQLSIRYGFFQLERNLKALVQGEPTLDMIFKQYGAAAKKTPQSFEHWLSGVSNQQISSGSDQAYMDPR